MSATLNLTDQNKSTLRSAAYGAVSLIAAASTKSHKAATAGSIALGSATGQIGHVLNAKSKDIHLSGKTVAELADQVLPALTEAVALLEQQDPTEADNFRTTVMVAVEAASTTPTGRPGPVVTDMIGKVNSALHTV